MLHFFFDRLFKQRKFREHLCSFKSFSFVPVLFFVLPSIYVFSVVFVSSLLLLYFFSSFFAKLEILKVFKEKFFFLVFIKEVFPNLF